MGRTERFHVSTNAASLYFSTQNWKGFKHNLSGGELCVFFGTCILENLYRSLILSVKATVNTEVEIRTMA